ncbi:MAG: PspC domain-containing protein [Bacteroidales bacterium]
MKKTIQVNIGKIAFMLDELSFDLINNYLESLKEHYTNNKNGDEIISGIEERMAELLLEHSSDSKFIKNEDAKEVIKILGNPEDIDKESGEEENTKGSTSSSNYTKFYRRFYRDTQNQKLGGICSGLGYLFNRDATLFRILLILVAILLPCLWNDSFFLVPLLYLIVWIAVPSAKTAREKREMKGGHISFSDIEKNVEEEANRYRSNRPTGFERLLKIIGKLFGILFIIIGLSGILALIFCLFNFALWGFSIASLMTYFSSALGLFIGGGTLQISLLIIILMPLLMVLYFGIIIIFNIKVPRWRPGIVMLIIWIASLIIFTIAGFSSFTKYSNTDTVSSMEEYSIPKDTLFITFDKVKNIQGNKYYISADRNDYKIFFMDKINKGPKFTMYPKVHINHYNNYGDKINQGCLEITLKKDVFPNTLSLSELNSKISTKFYKLEDNILTISPLVLEKKTILTEINQKINIAANKNLIIIIKQPKYHDFTSSYEYTNMGWLNIND